MLSSLFFLRMGTRRASAGALGGMVVGGSLAVFGGISTKKVIYTLYFFLLFSLYQMYFFAFQQQLCFHLGIIFRKVGNSEETLFF